MTALICVTVLSGAGMLWLASALYLMDKRDAVASRASSQDPGHPARPGVAEGARD